MDRTAVSSSNITSVGYDANSETLEIEFNSGGIYQYYNFPQFMYDQFMQSGSLGTFFHANIKDAYSCSRV
jgi:hypothetical protein